MSNPTPAYQRPFQSALLAAAIWALLAFVLPLFFKDWWDALSDDWQKWLSVGILLLVLVVFSIWNPRWRKGWGVLFGLRINRRGFRDSLEEKGMANALAEVTAAQEELRNQGRADALAEVTAAHEELVKRGRTEALTEVEAVQQTFIDQGRDEVREQVARERAAAKKPVFHIERTQWLSMDGEDAFWLYNGGAPTLCVSVEADNELWQPGKPVGLADTFKGDPVGAGVAKQFDGLVTEPGYANGITFTVHYLDQNGDPQTQPVMVPPDKLRRVDRQGNPLS